MTFSHRYKRNNKSIFIPIEKKTLESSFINSTLNANKKEMLESDLRLAD